jgi:hypothetical protein
MKYVVEKSQATRCTYVPSFVKVSWGVQNVLGDNHSRTTAYTHRQQDDLTSLILYIEYKENRPKVDLKEIACNDAERTWLS